MISRKKIDSKIIIPSRSVAQRIKSIEKFVYGFIKLSVMRISSVFDIEWSLRIETPKTPMYGLHSSKLQRFYKNNSTKMIKIENSSRD